MYIGNMYIGGDLATILIYFGLGFILATIFSIFSPLGIGFIIFSIVRGKTESSALKKVSFIFQIILSALTFLIGILISVFLILQNHLYNGRFSMPTLNEISPVLGIFFGVVFVIIIEIVFIFWENSWIKKKDISDNQKISNKRR